MPPRILNFLPLDALFFILNILGHDVYHDFGSDSGRLIDSMAALNMINSFLGLAGGTKGSQTQLEHANATPIRKQSFISKLEIKNPFALEMGPGQRVQNTPTPILTPNTRRVTQANAAQGRQSVPSARFQPSPTPGTRYINTNEINEQKAKERIELKKAQDKVEAAKQKYDAKPEEERQKIEFDAYITYIAENIQIAYEFNVFNYLFLPAQRFRLYNNLNYNRLNVQVNIFNTYSVEEKMYLLLSLLDQTQDFIYGNKNILDRDINKLIYCNQVFISINKHIALKYLFHIQQNQQNQQNQELLVKNFRNFLKLDRLKDIIWDNSGFSKNNAHQMEVEEVVWETDNEEDEEITGMKRKIAGGPPDTNLTIPQSQSLLIEFTNELARTENNLIFNELRDRDFGQTTKVSGKSKIKSILDKNRQYKTIDILVKVIDDVIQSFKKNTSLDNVEKITMLNTAYKVFITRKITEYTEKIADMIAEQEAARAARVARAAEEAARAAERAAIQAAREAQGQPGPKHLSVRNDFMETIIKMVLVNCGIYQFNGDPATPDLNVQMNQPYINMGNAPNAADTNETKDFTKQLGILIAKSPFSYPQGWTRVPGVPDDVLFEHFKEDHQSIKNISPPARSTLSYIVNNAALIGQHGLDGNYFCPISSILDGQSTCGYNPKNPNTASGDRGLERGNMDFKIQHKQNANLYYNGKSRQTGNPAQYTYEINLGFPGKPEIQLNKQMTLGGDDLTAQKALKHTLDSMIAYYTNKGQPNLDPSIGFFDNLYRLFFNNDINFTTNMYQILFKGSGDLFQEINAVCKNGGYVTTPTYYDSSIAEFTNKNQGDALRAFYANDRPSACRAFKFLRDGNQSEINQNAFGGYVGKDDESYLYFIKPINKYIVTGGKANKTKKRQQNIKKRNQVTKRRQATTKRRTKRNQ